MAILTTRRLSLRDRVCLCAVVTLCVLYYMLLTKSGPGLNLTKRDAILQYIENKLKEELKTDKGTGCDIPVLDPFSEDVTKFDKDITRINCDGQDWVKCYHSKCKVVDEIKDTVKDITCVYRAILFQNDQENILGPANVSESYELRASDYATVSCTGVGIFNKKQLKWSGNVLGLRSTAEPKKPPPGREGSLNVLIFAFDSTARNGFIRRMPKSWKVLTEELGASVMEGYNIVGDGTAAALFPILTGKTELELPDVRKNSSSPATLEACPFIFYKLKEDGYRTAYFEDMPEIGTFQYRFIGFQHPPSDHYLRAFFLEEQKNKNKRLWKDERGNLTFHYNFEGLKDRVLLHGPHPLQMFYLENKRKDQVLDERRKHCVGDTPQYKLMINITEQFMALEGKRFGFTMIVDITHNDFNMAQSADEDIVEFLRGFRRHRDDTLLVVMGDHGPRFAKFRNTVQGKLEERLPLMALLLPRKLLRSRPQAEAALRGNARVLTTPHDLHATLLDVLGMTQYANTYRVQGADLKRGLSMLEPIPRNRSCSEAGVEPHWCACLVWDRVSASDPVYDKAAQEFLRLINTLLKEAGSQCVPRTLTSVEWVLRQRPNNRLLSFVQTNRDSNLGLFRDETKYAKENYQIRVAVGPGRAVFEASLTYVVSEDLFLIHPRDISRTNAYGNEPDCISETHPHLNFYCYCRH